MKNKEKAELTIRKRLTEFRRLKQANPGVLVGVLGCMAERLKSKLLEEEKLVDMVVGPDAYRSLPGLIEEAETGQKAVNVLLSRDETYADIAPVRLDSNGISAFVSIMRGCNNMCSFCVVPFTRGRERSRDAHSIVAEATDLFNRGFKEVTLLGQNVDSYLWYGGGLKKDYEKATDMQKATAMDFAQLLDKCAMLFPKMRFRFSTSNPQDMHEEVLHVIAKHHNICNYIHLPVQSGSTRILKEMNRQHTREEYMALIDKIYAIIPDISLSQDMIAGFPTETEADHQDTLSLMEYVKYDFGFMFAYSERPGTLAARKMEDDVPEAIKKRRLTEIVDLQQKHGLERTKRFIGQEVEVLIEKESKRSDAHWSGRNSQNTVVVFPKENFKVGEFVLVKITDCTAATLIGEAVGYSKLMN
jgi:tRNA-2-methylthio-N6-dimethylallyladenosine synthase